MDDFTFKSLNDFFLEFFSVFFDLKNYLKHGRDFIYRQHKIRSDNAKSKGSL